jgi:hypothetical protein
MRPVDVTRPRPARPSRTGKRTANRLPCLVSETMLDLGEDLSDHLARRGPRFIGQNPVEFHQHRDQTNVGLDRRQEFGFQHQLAQVKSLDRITLQHLHDRLREVPPDIAKPADDARLRTTEAARTAATTASPTISAFAIV